MDCFVLGARNEAHIAFVRALIFMLFEGRPAGRVAYRERKKSLLCLFEAKHTFARSSKERLDESVNVNAVFISFPF